MDYYLGAFKKYADFSGRARRAEYWYFVLFNSIAVIITLIIDGFLGMGITVFHVGVIYLIYVLAAIVPSLAVSVRRLHDVGKSGWMLFISAIPIIGGIWLLILDCRDSMPGDNEYGSNPKMVPGIVPATPEVPQAPNQA